MVLFSVLAMTLFQFGLGTRQSDLTPFAGGLLWVILALTAVLGVGRSYVVEREQRVLDGLLAGYALVFGLVAYATYESVFDD